MSYETFIEKKFNPANQQMLNTIDAIVKDYRRQGYMLTVRQIYYQLVARDFIENTLQSYKRIASLINDGKLAGELDWDAIEDRTRSFTRRNRWDDATEMLSAQARWYHQDLWANQENRVFVIIEKEALVGVLNNLCYRYDVPLLAARGYPSGSVLYDFVVNQMQAAADEGQCCRIIHLGDHDPSGIDMSRDLEERIDLFSRGDIYYEFTRIALNMDQIDELKPPENPAKTTDSRYQTYIKKFGRASWELDALTPSYLNDLVEHQIQLHIDDEEWESTKESIEETKRDLVHVAARWQQIVGDIGDDNV